MTQRVPNPDHRCLFLEASSQHGYFTAAQARVCGLSWDLLSDGTERGKYLRVRRGLYRLRDYPTAPREEVVAAWLAAGKDTAVVSHESALELLELSDVIPNAIHLTVPRTKRFLSIGPDVVIHTSSKPFKPGEVIERDGIRLRPAGCTILDSAELGTGPEQIEMAIALAISRGLVTFAGLASAAEDRSHRVRRLVTDTLRWIRARDISPQPHFAGPRPVGSARGHLADSDGPSTAGKVPIESGKQRYVCSASPFKRTAPWTWTGWVRMSSTGQWELTASTNRATSAAGAELAMSTVKVTSWNPAGTSATPKNPRRSTRPSALTATPSSGIPSTRA